MEAKEIKAIRLKLGKSQKDFGAMVGVTGTSIYKYEHGRSKPHPVFEAKIAELAKEITQ